MLLHDSRRLTRETAQGEFVRLEHQNRALWQTHKIEEGVTLLKKTLTQHQLDPYQCQAAISAVHAESPSWPETDWQQVLALYDTLLHFQPTPVVRLNRAVAASYAQSSEQALLQLQRLREESSLECYAAYWIATADVLSRLEYADQTKHALAKAIDLSQTKAEQRYLTNWLESID